MGRGYTYLISFKGTNDIYIGKTTKSIKERLKGHKVKKCAVCDVVDKKLNGNWNDVCIDIIDSVDMDEDLTDLLNHPSNVKYNALKKSFLTHRKYTYIYNTKKQLAEYKLAITEQFHINIYKDDDKYNLINRKISKFDNFKDYEFFQYS